MNVVDSSGWLEYFAKGASAAFFAPAIEQTDQLIVPSIVVYEVYKRLLQSGGNPRNSWNISLLLDAYVVSLNGYLAIEAAELSLQHKLPLADSTILATARLFGATLWTQDAHFAGIAGVQYIAKP